jgi:hypothetical protein
MVVSWTATHSRFLVFFGRMVRTQKMVLSRLSAHTNLTVLSSLLVHSVVLVLSQDPIHSGLLPLSPCVVRMSYTVHSLVWLTPQSGSLVFSGSLSWAGALTSVGSIGELRISLRTRFVICGLVLSLVLTHSFSTALFVLTVHFRLAVLSCHTIQSAVKVLSFLVFRFPRLVLLQCATHS